MTSRTAPSRLEKVGPYRVEALLGRGGMGTVYRAWDTRLDRPVAIKRRHRVSGGDARDRRRLAQEARAGAVLNHPAIVQVYDIFKTQNEDWLVMELVAGETLADRLARDGPLAPTQAAALGQQVAEALHFAHQAGVIHRDLKAENVMVTADGGVKVLDFGVAHRGREAASDPVGTLRAMAPEQAVARRVDARADLFALGVMLYEAVTGLSPFLASTRQATLERLLTQAPPPLPVELPSQFRLLIDHLLEKDPGRRPIDAHAVARRLADLAESLRATPAIDPPRVDSTTLELTTEETFTHPSSVDDTTPIEEQAGMTDTVPWWRSAIAGLLISLAVIAIAARDRWPKTPNKERLYVAVPKVEMPKPASDQAPEITALALTVRAAILRGLSQLAGIAPFDSSFDHEIPRDLKALSYALAVDELITARLDCAISSACQITLSRRIGQTGEVRWSQTLPVLADRPVLAAEAVAAALSDAYPTRPSHALVPLEVSDDVWRRYVQLTEAFEHAKEGELTPLLARAEALRQEAPGFAGGHRLTAWMHLLRYRQHREPADLEALEGAIAAAHEAGAQTSDPETLTLEIRAAISAGRFELAETRLADLKQQQPASPDVLALRGHLLDARGDLNGALAAYQTSARLHPAWNRLLNLAEIAYRAGETEVAREAVRRALERQPESFYARSLQAQIELLYGEPEIARRLYEGLVSRSPEAPELTNLGVAHLLVRDFSAAAEVFERALTAAPEDPATLLNLADALKLSGDEARALETYRQLLQQVPPTVSDPHQQSWRAQALSHLRKTSEAQSLITAALATAPENPQIAYEAALVFALTGDLDQAAHHAEAALQAGVERRWFELPWFDPLREQLRRLGSS